MTGSDGCNRSLGVTLRFALPCRPSLRPPRHLRREFARRLAWLVWDAALIEAGLVRRFADSLPEAVSDRDRRTRTWFAAFLISVALVVMVFATAGLLVTRQQPHNAVGWLMLVGGPAVGAVFAGYVVGVSLVESGASIGSWFVLGGGVLFGPALYLLGPGLGSSSRRADRCPGDGQPPSGFP